MTNSWNDNWVPNVGSLLPFYNTSLSLVDSSRTVSEFVLKNGRWNIGLLRDSLPARIFNKINAMISPHPSNVSDRLAWSLTNDGVFTLASVIPFSVKTGCYSFGL